MYSKLLMPIKIVFSILLEQTICLYPNNKMIKRNVLSENPKNNSQGLQFDFHILDGSETPN